jgi:DNA-binding transcriptional LysR family regulator
MKSLDLNLLNALDVLLSTGSVSAAAHRMHLSTPAMSHTLARIREALGDPILVRAGRRLVPTPHALELREPVRRLVAEARELMRPGDGLHLPRLQREFVVRAPDGIGVIHGAVLLAALRQTMPLVTLRFVPEVDSDGQALREGRIDIDIGAVHDRGPEVRTEALYVQRIVAAVRAGHALTAARVTLKRFVGEAHVAIAQRGRAAEAVDRALAAAGCKRAVALTVPSAYGALMAAARSDLVACGPQPMVRGVAAGLGLEEIKLPVAVPDEQVVQAWHPRMDADPAHRQLRHCVAALSRGPFARGPVEQTVGSATTRHHDLLTLAAAGSRRR